MEGFIDLHTHSTASDGTLTPYEVVKKAKEAGLTAIALTDHDTLDGLSEAIEAGRQLGIEVVTGIEFSVDGDCAIHMLGLDFNINCPKIKNELAHLLEQRNLRNMKMIEHFNDNGVNITPEDILAESTSIVVGRTQFARALIKKGYISTIPEAFEKYFYPGSPYEEIHREKITPKKAIEIIKASGGKSFVAHLHQMGKSDAELYDLLREYKSYGLDGIEGYYTEYDEDMGNRFRKMAKDLDLILSGGSDFHGNNKIGHMIGIGNGNLRIPYSILENMRNF